MTLLNNPAVGFLVIFLAALLGFGECLVKAKGVFGATGSALFLLYFLHHLPGRAPVLMLALMIIGFICLVIDAKLINNGSVALIGFFLMLAACALPAPTAVYGVCVAVAFLLGSAGALFLLKIFPRRTFWSKIMLTERLTSEQGYDSLNKEYKGLVGKTGRTATPCRPVGTIEVEGKRYSATTEDYWLDPGVPIVVTKVDGTKLVIAPLAEERRQEE
ncbi:NfeD family protein [Caenibacillus caldisaponilyticus]|uniref:NfeD family protein n=1 Tax=Caenibacillus caldisaponilyticus TaxID=1674942 RepID=UPI0009887F1D|nr:NfeD family protein [Caenibacillus caldisaponilyticus]